MRRLLMIAVLLMAGPAAYAVDGLVVQKSPYSVSESLDRMSALLEKKGIKVIARVPHTQAADKVGIQMDEVELLIFGNPKLGSPLMQSQVTTAIDLPMKMIAWKDADGQVWIGYNDPAWIAKRHGITDRDAVISKMSGALKGLSAKVVAP